MASQRHETKQTKNENEQNYEWCSNDEQSQEQMIMFRQNLGWHSDYGVKGDTLKKLKEVGSP